MRNVGIAKVICETLWIRFDAAKDLLHGEILHDGLNLWIGRGALNTHLSLLLRDILVEDETLDLLETRKELRVAGMNLEAVAIRLEGLVVHLEEGLDGSLATEGLDCNHRKGKERINVNQTIKRSNDQSRKEDSRARRRRKKEKTNRWLDRVQDTFHSQSKKPPTWRVWHKRWHDWRKGRDLWDHV